MMIDETALYVVAAIGAALGLLIGAFVVGFHWWLLAFIAVGAAALPVVLGLLFVMAWMASGAP